MPDNLLGLSEEELLRRLGGPYSRNSTNLFRREMERARDLKISKVVRCRVRYFTDDAVIGSKAFVDGVFRASRERFGPKRKDGARKPCGALGEMVGEIWSLRDFKAD